MSGVKMSDLTIDGDLNQMSIQSSFLRTYGLELERVNVYSIIKSDDVESALTLLWTHSIEGWWHYLDKYKEFDICTDEQFQLKLKLSVERRRNEY